MPSLSRPWPSASTASKNSYRSCWTCGPRRRAIASASTACTTTWRARPGCPSRCSDPTRPSSWAAQEPKRTPAPAAAYADEFNRPFHPLDVAAPCYQRVGEACRRLGRDPAQVIYSAALTVCCGRNDAEVARRAERIGRGPERIDLAGTPARIIDRLAAWAAAGAARTHLQFLDLDDVDHVDLVAAEVLPAVGGLSSA